MTKRLLTLISVLLLGLGIGGGVAIFIVGELNRSRGHVAYIAAVEHFDRRDYEAAVIWAHLALAFDPGQYGPSHLAGQAYDKLGQLRLAKIMLETALKSIEEAEEKTKSMRYDEPLLKEHLSTIELKLAGAQP